MEIKNKSARQAIRDQLERILEEDKFKGSTKQREFLKFVVEETLQDRASQLKAYIIAVAVYGRPKQFDPQMDPIVRVEAGRLRRALERYYLTIGEADPILIEIPIGKYIPTFRMVDHQTAGRDMPVSTKTEDIRPTRPSIAIMPLLNLTGDDAQNYFVDGLTEELTSELARYQDFRVIASQSTMHFKGKTVDPIAVGRNLGARFLLSGSVRKDSDTVKVIVRMIDTSSGVQIWGGDYKRNLTPTGLIAMQEEIGQRVVGIVADQYGLISRKLSMESRKKAPADFKVYDAILHFYHYEIVLTPDTFKEALEALERAVAMDPEYGLAWAMLGHLHADNYALGFCEIEKSLEKALTYALRGMALAPGNQFASDALTLVYFHRGDKDLFLKHAELTIALNPNSPYIIGVAGWHTALLGEWDLGLGLLRKGIKLNPYHPSWFHLAFYMDFYRSGAYEKAFTEALKFNLPGLYIDPMIRAAALGQLGRITEAKTAVRQLLTLKSDFIGQEQRLISHYVKADGLAEKIIEGLKKAGIDDVK